MSEQTHRSMCDYCKKPRIGSLTVVIYFFQSTGFEVIHKPEFKAWLHHVVTMNVWQVNFTSLNRTQLPSL